MKIAGSKIIALAVVARSEAVYVCADSLINPRKAK